MADLQAHPVLGQVAIGYSPMIDRQRGVIATRLTVFPERPDGAPDAVALLRALEAVWPAESPANAAADVAADAPADAPADASGKAPVARPLNPPDVTQRDSAARRPVSLNLAGEALLSEVMAKQPGTQLMVEVPAFMAGDKAHIDALRALHAAGTALLIKGRPLAPLPPDVLALFSHSIVEAGDDRRGATPAPSGVRSVTTVQAGARSSADIEAAFQRGAVAVLGWPWDDAPPKAVSRASVPGDVNTVMALISGVEREAPVAQLEALLRKDPVLAYRLMRYLNSPAFGLSVEINSFSHAIMMLGYQRLKRWLAVLLASSAKGINAKSTIYAAVRRGLLMEDLGRENADADMRSELFICGVFSLLDRLLQQPLQDLLPSVPVSERVQKALRGESSPFLPYLDLVRAIEQESLFDIRAHSETLMLGPAAVNRAVLTALRAARQLDS